MWSDSAYLRVARELGYVGARESARLKRELRTRHERGDDASIREVAISLGILDTERDRVVVERLAGATDATVQVRRSTAPLPEGEVDLAPENPVSIGSRVATEGAAGQSRYSTGSVLGRGGMGEVVSAYDRDLRREVAVKTLHSKEQAASRRFVEEAQITGQLEHPNIVPIHELGIDPDGRPFLVMKRVRGRSLTDMLRAMRRKSEGVSLATFLGIFRKALDAVAYAHSRGILHCDLNPNNIMVGEFGEVLVMDWGLARVLSQSASESGAPPITTIRHEMAPANLTMEGVVRGTPAFMSPEQATGALSQLDVRSDIYALGAILYSILTLSPPFKGKSAENVLDQVVRMELERPSERSPWAHVPRELEAVVLKAMGQRKEERYQRVEELAAEVDAYLSGRTLAAALYSPWEVLVKWAKRNRVAVAGAAATALVGTAGLVVAAILLARANVLEIEADRSRLVALDEARTKALEEARALANDLHSKAEHEIDEARLVPWSPADPEEYFRARLAALAGLAESVTTHPEPPGDWTERLAAETLEIQERAAQAGEWALAEHIARSARQWGAIDETRAEERVLDVREKRRQTEQADVARLDAILEKIRAAEKLGERQGFVPGELGEEARRLAALRSRAALTKHVLETLADDDRRMTESPAAGEERLGSLARSFLVQALGHLGDAVTSHDGLTAAAYVAQTLQSDVTYIPADELAAWLAAAVRLEATHHGSFGDPGVEPLLDRVATASEGVGPVAMAVDEAREFLSVARGLAALPPPVAGDAGRFEAIVAALGDWVASAALSGPAYTARLLELALGSRALSIREEEFVFDQLGLSGDVEPPDPARPDRCAQAVLATALEALPTGGGAEEGVEAQLAVRRAVKAAINLARIEQGGLARSFFLARERAGERSRFQRGTELAARRMPLDDWTVSRDPEECLAHAEARFARGNAEGAFADIETALLVAPDSPRVLDRRGVYRWRTGDAQSAYEDFTRAIQIDPSFAPALAHRGDLVYNAAIEHPHGSAERKEMAAAALADLDRALALDPENARGHTIRGLCGNEAGVGGDAEAFARAIEIDPTEHLAHFMWANGCVWHKNWKEAIERYSRAIDADPLFLQAYFARARAWLEIERLDEAVLDYTRVAQFDPGNIEAFWLRARLRARLGEAKGAAQDFLRVVEIDRSLWQAWVERGQILAASRELEEAARSFEEALRSAPAGQRGAVEEARRQALGR